jgi:flagella basal body P-ring formation protein FlgA
MIRIVLALVLLFAVSQDARSADAPTAPTPRLKELVAVASDVVRIGDLVEHAAAAAAIPVFRAPDLGQTGAVAVSRVTEALRPHGLIDIDTAGLREVVVTRLSRAIAAIDIEERIVRAIAGNYGYGEARNLTISPDRPLRSIHVEPDATGELMLSRVSVEPRSGRFDMSFEIAGSALTHRQPLRVTGTVTETVETATLLRPVARGDVIKASDVTTERRPKSDRLNGALGADQAIGLAVKRALRAGDLLRGADLMKPEIVRRNETVTIIYQVPGILLTVRGKALEAGARGDVISVTNIQSKRTVQAAVAGPGRVVIAAPEPLLTTAAAPDPETERPRTQ